MKCTVCETQNTDYARFCKNCGKPLDPVMETQPRSERNDTKQTPVKPRSTQTSIDGILEKCELLKNRKMGIQATPWIMGLRVASTVLMLACVVFGICIWSELNSMYYFYNSGWMGFAAFLGCCAAGFFFVAFGNVILDMALDNRATYILNKVIALTCEEILDHSKEKLSADVGSPMNTQNRNP